MTHSIAPAVPSAMQLFPCVAVHRKQAEEKYYLAVILPSPITCCGDEAGVESSFNEDIVSLRHHLRGVFDYVLRAAHPGPLI